MELLQTEDYYIINKKENSLWFDKKNGAVKCKTCWDLASAKNPNCLGVIYAILGKIHILPDFSPRLVLVVGTKEVGSIREHFERKESKKVYSITRVIFLPVTSPLDCELNLSPCSKHHILHPNSLSQDRRNILPFSDLHQKVGFSKTFGTIKNVTSTIKTATVNAAANATGQNKSRKDARDKERFEKRILDELLKMFTESESFYFCNDADITNSLQRRSDPSYDISMPLWKRADERFFWNKHMLLEFQNGDNLIPDIWLVPVIQGFIQIEKVQIDSADSNVSDQSNQECAQHLDPFYTFTLISRRSRERAGTRYKRRGVDEEGNVANYVETEQLLTFSHHQVSFVQVRGSVPVYWSQPGYKYRPPPRLDRNPEEIAIAFKKHFDKELEVYERVSCISLGEQTGKEKVISDAYLNNVMMMNCPKITFVSFDFHEYCRGMRYENVSILIEGIDNLINSMSYCWVDNQGTICRQDGVFRVNCIDCLDRTNVVQTALARAALESQFAKLGILPPEYPLPQNCRSVLQMMWANNGDTISKQYAGTSALKGDFTRTGERNFTGLMKDGMNSANRYYVNHFHDTYRQAAIDLLLNGELGLDVLNDINYLETVANVTSALMPCNPPQYMADIALSPEKHLAGAVWSISRYYLNRFKDAYRQASIDTMLGNPISDDLMTLNIDLVATEEEDASIAQHVKHVIDDCKKLLVPDAETILGAWGLIDADPWTGDPDQTDMDIILVLTRDSFYIAQYDEDSDRILDFQRISLIDLHKIELGPYTYQSVFKQARTYFCVRLNYQVDGHVGYHCTFRSMNMRFFNNMAVTIKTDEEILESMKAIADTFEVASQMIGCEVEVVSGKLEKIKSRGKTPPTKPFQLLSPINTLTKTSPDTIKSVGTRAFSNMTSGLAKLNPMANIRFRRAEALQVGLTNSQFYMQTPIVTVVDSMIIKPKQDLYLVSCGILTSCLPSDFKLKPKSSPNRSKSLSESCITHATSDQHGFTLSANRAPTPEILVSGEGTAFNLTKEDMQNSNSNILLSSLRFSRLRKLSHSSDDMEIKEDEDGGSGIHRASSVSELDLQLPLERKVLGSTSSTNVKSITFSPLSPLSPLNNFNKEAVLAPFSVLARGVQSLAPGAGKLARGVQNIGVNLDPRKLKAQRQKQLEENVELKTRILKCKSQIIQL